MMQFQMKSAKTPELNIALDNFKDGVITLVDETRLPFTAAKEATNLIQTMDGRYTTAPGVAEIGVDMGAAIDGAFMAVTAAGDGELLVLAGGTLYRVDNDAGTKTALSGATFTAGVLTSFLQIRDKVLIANGTDPLVQYDFSSLHPYTALTQPSISGVSRTNLTAGSYNAYYIVVALNEVGHSLPSAEASVSGGINRARDSWSGTDKLTISWGAVTGAVRYELYYSDTSGRCTLLTSVPGGVTSFDDTGAKQPNPYVEAPLDDTTLGPKFSVMELSGNRIWATGDPANRYRVYFGGVGNDQLSFTDFSGGGWVDLEQGGREYPRQVVHFRDGKGGSQVTVLTASPGEPGSIWQIEIVSATVGDYQVTIPSPVKIVGSIGTDAPRSVVKVNDSIMFFNRRGVFSLGSKPNLLNVLSTDELSANIRPFIQSLRGDALPGVAGYYKDGRVYWAVPASAGYNNQIVAFDLERRNWNPAAMTFGVRQFFEFTDSSGQVHFYAIPNNGQRLLEISNNYQGHLDDAFSTNYLSGRYPVSKNRLDWARIEYLYVTLNNPQGQITVELLGTEKRKGFSSLGSLTISDALSNSGWGAIGWNRLIWGQSNAAPKTYTQASVTKRLRVRKLLNNFQVRVATNNLTARYTLLSAQVKGRLVPTSDPQSWRS